MIYFLVGSNIEKLALLYIKQSVREISQISWIIQIIGAGLAFLSFEEIIPPSFSICFTKLVIKLILCFPLLDPTYHKINIGKYKELNNCITSTNQKIIKEKCSLWQDYSLSAEIISQKFHSALNHKLLVGNMYHITLPQDTSKSAYPTYNSLDLISFYFIFSSSFKWPKPTCVCSRLEKIFMSLTNNKLQFSTRIVNYEKKCSSAFLEQAIENNAREIRKKIKEIKICNLCKRKAKPLEKGAKKNISNTWKAPNIGSTGLVHMHEWFVFFHTLIMYYSFILSSIVVYTIIKGFELLFCALFKFCVFYFLLNKKTFPFPLLYKEKKGLYIFQTLLVKSEVLFTKLFIIFFPLATLFSHHPNLQFPDMNTIVVPFKILENFYIVSPVFEKYIGCNFEPRPTHMISCHNSLNLLQVNSGPEINPQNIQPIPRKSSTRKIRLLSLSELTWASDIIIHIGLSKEIHFKSRRFISRFSLLISLLILFHKVFLFFYLFLFFILSLNFFESLSSYSIPFYSINYSNDYLFDTIIILSTCRNHNISQARDFLFCCKRFLIYNFSHAPRLCIYPHCHQWPVFAILSPLQAPSTSSSVYNSQCPISDFLIRTYLKTLGTFSLSSYNLGPHKTLLGSLSFISFHAFTWFPVFIGPRFGALENHPSLLSLNILHGLSEITLCYLV
ncbi:hypothetical protein VP01_3658g1 [Puccinia sorghi]|uniref:Uncharacterized protein n=1 Tax=Puccinia sorghi TaxID=27349 RepID=A0A0L6UUL1_9BASI|nr:hypothetical protein VP01_3658g1 [Puccinia sorghi]